MRLFCCLMILGACSRAEVVDRIAVIVDREVITESQITEELRIAAFLNQESLVQDASTRRAATNRLIAQELISREMEISNYLRPTSSEVDAYLLQVRDTLGASRFQADLKSYGLSEPVLREHLALQLTTLKFVDYRFRPEGRQPVGPGRALEQETDEALTSWLEQRRKQVKIVYLDRSLK